MANSFRRVEFLRCFAKMDGLGVAIMSMNLSAIFPCCRPPFWSKYFLWGRFNRQGAREARKGYDNGREWPVNKLAQWQVAILCPCLVRPTSNSCYKPCTSLRTGKVGST